MTKPAHNRPLPDLSKIKAVLFDVDGTLTNSDPLHFKAFYDILQQYGYKVRAWCSLMEDVVCGTMWPVAYS